MATMLGDELNVGSEDRYFSVFEADDWCTISYFYWPETNEDNSLLQ